MAVLNARRELESLTRKAGARGALLAGRDGLLVEATMDRQRAEALSALIAVSFGAAAGLGDGIPALGGEPEELMLEADGGTLHVMPSGDERLLALLSNPTVNLGVLRLEMRQAATRLAAS